MSLTKTALYKIEHNLKEPSKMSDYDYDPNNIKRRFYSTFFTEADFKDPITDVEIVKLFFDLEVAGRLIVGLYDIMYKESNNPHPVIRTVKGVFVNDSSTPCMSVLSKSGQVFQVSFICEGEHITLTFINEDDLDKFIQVLQSDGMVDYYYGTQDVV